MSQFRQEYDQVVAQLTAPGAPWELAEDTAGLRYFVKAPRNLAEAIAVARQHGDREFLVYEGERRTFNNLLDEAERIAAALQAHGIGAGDRVALAMRNYPEWMAAFIAVVTTGAVIVPLNSWGQPAEIARLVADADARLVFCDQARFDGLAASVRDPAVRLVIARPTRRDDPAGLDSFLSASADQAATPVAIRGDDLAMIMYTSGTSGVPKGAASTHAAICQALYNFEFAAAAAAMCNGEAITAMLERGYEPTSLLALPLFHVSGCHAQFLTNLRGGRRVVMMYKWDVARALDYIERERITTIAAAPAMVLDLLESPDFDRADTASLFSLGVGGAATPPRISRLLEGKLPGSFSGTGWGMTETNAQGASLTGRFFRDKPGSAGPLHPIVDLRICDELGGELAPGVAGEIWVRSPTNIREYWRRLEVNQREFHDGWLKTGDVGYLDEDGFLFLADRVKDMIIRGGENVYPVEVENQLLQLEAVREVAVIGLPHDRLGEEVAAVVRLHSGERLSEAQLLAYAREHLAAYKVPTQVFFVVEDLPRTATGKVLKQQLKAAIGTGLQAGLDANKNK